jgi:hypothetical protein
VSQSVDCPDNLKALDWEEMTGCYIDESGTDSNLPTAVVAGLLLDSRGYFWLDVEWSKILACHRFRPPLHMRNLPPLPPHRKEALFKDLVSAINEHKLMTLAATLSAEKYRTHFDGIDGFSMYAACSVLHISYTGGILNLPGGAHRWPLSYVLDDGNPYQEQLTESGATLLKQFPRIARIDVKSDSEVNALQAADVVAWAVRRQLSKDAFPRGLEPLANLFDAYHVEAEYEESWMKEVADTVRALAKAKRFLP